MELVFQKNQKSPILPREGNISNCIMPSWLQLTPDLLLFISSSSHSTSITISSRVLPPSIKTPYKQRSHYYSGCVTALVAKYQITWITYLSVPKLHKNQRTTRFSSKVPPKQSQVYNLWSTPDYLQIFRLYTVAWLVSVSS